MLEGHNAARLEDFMLAQRFSVVFVVLCAIAVFNGGCGATIGPAPAKLSAEVGDRISEMQGVHQLALESHFRLERARIETFLQEEWIPYFLNEYLGSTAFIEKLRDAEDPAKLSIQWVTAAQTEIALRRKEMLQPVMEAERIATAELAQAYADILKANGVVTARLEAAAERKALQDSILQTLGAVASTEPIRQALTKVSSTVTDVIDKKKKEMNL